MKLLAVNFHYIRDDIYDSGIYPRTAKQLSEQIDELSKYYSFISQDELNSKIKNKSFDNKAYCLLTFDDGLKEQMDALDVLNKKGVPGVFYVTTGSIRDNTVVDVHKLHYIRSILPDKDIYAYIYKNIDSSVIKYPANIDELYRYDTMETKKLKYLLNFILDAKVKENIIDGLFKTLTDEKNFSKKLYMDKSAIQELGKLGYLGTHCDLHLPLATLTNKQIKKEIDDSILFLEKTCDAGKITSISYPYGGPKAVSQNVADIASQYDFGFGLTMFRGMNSMEDLKNPFMLKRVDTNDAPGGKSKSTEFYL